MKRTSMNSVWTILSSDIAYPNNWARIRRDTVQLPDGSVTDYYLAERPHVALVLAFTGNDDAVLVHQYKHGAGTHTTELPGGTFTDEEDPSQAAERELYEETGYVCPAPLRHIATFYDDASKNTNRVHIFVGENAEPRSVPKLDPLEEAAGLKTVLIHRSQLRSLIANGTIRALSSVAGIHHALDDAS